MLERTLMVVSASIVLALGTIHLVYTFVGPRLTPRDPTVRQRMTEAPLVITTETTMWKAWVGFNVTHSMGAILFGLLYAYLAIQHGRSLFNSSFLLGVGLAVLVAYVLVSRYCFFSVPFGGMCAALVSYAAVMVAAIVARWSAM